MNNLRPTKLKDIIGQEESMGILKIAIDSALERNTSVPHVIADGPAGTGKSTIGMAVGNEMGSNTLVINAGEVSSPKDILPKLMKLEDRDILFIDEIHRLNIKIAEFLYPIMEDFKLDTNELSVSLPNFTLIGATTEAGSLSKPLYDRFTYKIKLTLYSTDDLAEIISSSAKKLNLEIDRGGRIGIARRSRGTPRIANNLLIWVRDYCLSKGLRIANERVVSRATGMMGLDRNGVTSQDRAYIEALKSSRKPMGLETISHAINVDKDTICGIIEPHLIRLKMISRTPKGRVLLKDYSN